MIYKSEVMNLLLLPILIILNINLPPYNLFIHLVNHWSFTMDLLSGPALENLMRVINKTERVPAIREMRIWWGEIYLHNLIYFNSNFLSAHITFAYLNNNSGGILSLQNFYDYRLIT